MPVKLTFLIDHWHFASWQQGVWEAQFDVDRGLKVQGDPRSV